jgi:hypothetical protein
MTSSSVPQNSYSLIGSLDLSGCIFSPMSAAKRTGPNPNGDYHEYSTDLA